MGQKKKECDMLHGPLLLKIIMFALPLAASSMLQQLFNSVDIAVVGRFASSDALAAVGSNASVISLLINLFIGVSMGANVVISIHIGQRDDQGIKNAINTVSLVSVISGIVLMIVGLMVARPILELMDTPPEVLDMAVLYLRIYFLGIPFFLIFNFGAAILRSLGDTKRPLYILVVAGIINTVLNLVFVLCFGMGVAGVAIATGIANCVSAVLIILLLMREREPFTLHLKEMKIKWSELKKMLEIGIPAGMQGMVFSVSNVLIQSAINGYGAAAIAGSAAAVTFEFYCYFIIEAFNGAAITFTGQNYGAGNYERVHRIFKICMMLGFVSCAALNWFFLWQKDFFLGLFTTDPTVVQYGTIRIYTALALQSIACSYEIAGSSLRGMGKSMTPTLFTILGTCLLRVAWVYLVCPHHPGIDVLFVAYPVSWALTGVMVCTAYWLTMRRLFAKQRPVMPL